jgi:cob(I)alamin adenosyltransferase
MYTRGGDGGKTTVVGGGRRWKDDLRIEAYGAVDEAGAFIGLALAGLSGKRDADIAEVLQAVLQRLWDVGADLANAAGDGASYRTPADAASGLESWIDPYQEEAGPLTHFVIRGGDPAAAALHVACTVVRRAERRTVALMQVEPIHAPALAYLNRVADLLFVLARVVNARAGMAEIPYHNGGSVFR